VYIRMWSWPHRVDQALASEPADRENGRHGGRSALVSVGPMPPLVSGPGSALDNRRSGGTASPGVERMPNRVPRSQKQQPADDDADDL
jgi:hypothetical protein